MQELYPLRFKPIYKDKVWGGNKIKTILKHDYQLPNCGEVWVISGVKENVSQVENGALKGQSLNQLLLQYKDKLVGEKTYKKFCNEFPLLIKFIDAADDLSVQVHPNDAVAEKKHNSKGKSEMWYMMNTDKNASIIIGFNKQMNKTKLKKAFDQKTVMQHLNKINVNPGDIFYLPAGIVHSIGAGCLLAEIQQTSDITYRIYDFDRPDANGQMRDLHVDDGIEATDFTMHKKYNTEYQKIKNKRIPVVNTPYFNNKIIDIDKELYIKYPNNHSFRIYICTKGKGIITTQKHKITLSMGEAILLPAIISNTTLTTSTEFELLETGFDY